MTMEVTGRVRGMLPHRLIEDASKKPLRLTRLAMQAADQPEDHEIDLALYSGRAIAVTCQNRDDTWCWGVQVVNITDHVPRAD